ncbi:MAG TPA: thiamine pyrophosphate-dependent enzyme, partial [Candidatus Macondimonas sp.]|nr:thiamine pyrophosphate-dependent enzyme [Candidatus Macondimonas sp.]
WQEFFYQKRYAMSYMEALPDFVRVAEAFGHVGKRIERPQDVRGALDEALALKDRLVLLDFVTDQTENVYPMIPAGAGQNEMILV